MATDDRQQEVQPEPAVKTRRAFLGGAGRKALYVTPIVLTLAGQQAFGSGPVCGSAFRHQVGSPCSNDGVDEKKCCPVDYDGNAMACHVPDGQTTGTCQPQ